MPLKNERKNPVCLNKNKSTFLFSEKKKEKKKKIFSLTMNLHIKKKKVEKIFKDRNLICSNSLKSI